MFIVCKSWLEPHRKALAGRRQHSPWGYSKRALAAVAVTLTRRWVVSPMGKLGTH